MSRVSEVLHNLDQLTLCVSLIKQTGAYHRRFNGFKPQYFKLCYTENVPFHLQHSTSQNEISVFL